MKGRYPAEPMLQGVSQVYPQGTENAIRSRYKTKIMTVENSSSRDERDKDVANSIRPAIDNGAKIPGT